MKTLTLDDFLRLRRLVYRGARPMEFTMWRHAFEGGGVEDALDVLVCYQNEDGGFGYNLEANLWNPHSSPMVTGYAIGQLGRVHFDDKDHPIVAGILKYLAATITEKGWFGSVPSNNDYSHAPWFGYDPETEPEAGSTQIDFILKYAEQGSELFQKAAALRMLRKPEEQPVPDFSDYDPTKFELWKPSPIDYAPSPESELYPVCKDLVEAQLDAMVERLHTADEFHFTNYGDSQDYEQIIGNYYWAASDYITQIETLNRFGRLEFQLPVDCGAN